MFAIEEMAKININFDRLAIGVIPFGTGNDLSRALGWGPAVEDNIIGKGLENLKKLLKKWINAPVMDLDIWEVEVKLFLEGNF